VPGRARISDLQEGKMQAYRPLIALSLLATLAGGTRSARAQRALGLDVSTYQGNITQTQWDNLLAVDNRQFVFIRASRGGTTGEDHGQGGYPSGDNYFNLSERYDDPYFVQNITRSTGAGLFAGPYHFARLDVVASTPNTGGVANTGTDEANHFIQMAGAWMRPGYLMPTYDLEAGQSLRTSEQIAQFSLDFSNRIYAVMGIRPAMYVNGNYSNVLASASLSLRDQLAKTTANPQPSVVGPAFTMLWNARYPTSPNPQTQNPRDTSNLFYGPFDDYGNSQPWNFWQYSSSGSLQGISPVDVNVSHGDIEYVKDYLVPAVWMNDSSGDWSAMANWNSGQAPVAPVVSAGQLPATATGPLPTPRAAGDAGAGITGGQNDTVILERPTANVTVTHSAGDHNVRKLYVREALNITGGSLTVNYDPNYAVPTDGFGNPLYPFALRSGPISAQFSAPVTLSGTGSFTANTLQVDGAQTFTVTGGTLSFQRMNLNFSDTTPATFAVGTTLNVSPPPGKTVAVSYGSNYNFIYPRVDLTGGDRTFNVAKGTNDVDLDISVEIANGALTKTGLGTMRLSGYSSYAGTTTVNAGKLIVDGQSGSGDLVVNNGAEVGGYGYVGGNLIVNSGGKRSDGGTVAGNVTVNGGGTYTGTGYIYSSATAKPGGRFAPTYGTTYGNLTADGGTIAPGDAAAVGSIVTYSDLNFTDGSTYEWGFNPAALTADIVNAGGTTNLSGNVALQLDNLGAASLPRNTKFNLITYGIAWNGGTFSGLPNNSLYNDGQNLYRIRYDDNAYNAANGYYYSNAITLTTLSGPVNGFIDEYDPIHWTTDDANAHGGFVYTGNAPYSITLYGPEDRSRQPGDIGYFITIPASGTLSFDWNYYDPDLPGYDIAYFLNGVETLLSDGGGFGHISIDVHEGDVLGWKIVSLDSVGGQGILEISNFLAPGLPVVPEPAALTVVVALAMLAAPRRRSV
jgi:autotransporter-associated beta strand protein